MPVRAGAAVLGLVAAGALLSPPAHALSAGVAFSADPLSTWQANGVVWSIAQAQGKVYAAGTFTQLRPPTGGAGAPVDRANFAVLDAETGSPDSCRLDVTFSGGSPTVRSVIASPDGSTVYIGGNFSNVGGTTVSRVAAIDTATCTVKPLRISSISSSVWALTLSGNTLYLGGAFNSVAGATRHQFAAVNATSGALLPFTADAGLTGRAAGVTADGRAMAVSPDGSKIALGGEFDTINGADSHSIAIVDASSGAVVRNYPDNFINRDSVTKSLVTAGNGLYAGNEGTGSGIFDGRFAIDWTTMDQVWRDNCLGATQAVLAYQGTLYSASHAHDCGSMGEFPDGQRNYFNAEPLSNPTLLGWHPQANDGIGEGIGPRALTVATGKTTGKNFLWAAGEFTKINGAAQQSLTRFGPDDTGNPPTVSPVAVATSSGTVEIRFRSVVDADDSDLTYKVYRGGSSTPMWTGKAKSLWWTRPQVTVVDSNVTAGTSYSYRVSVTDGTNTSPLSSATSATAVAARSDYASAVRADDPTFYWRFDETSGTWVQDSSGATVAGVNGLSYNSPTQSVSGAIDGSTAYSFDGTNDQVVPDQLMAAPSTYTVETWIKTTTTAGGKIIGFGDGRPRTDTGALVPSTNYDRQIYMENGGRLDFGAYTGSYRLARSTASYNDGRWHHVVGVQGSNGLTLYVDGVTVGRNTSAGALSYSGVWHVGGDNVAGWPNQPSSGFFKGAIDETAVYPAALSAQQVVAHYVAGGGTPTTARPSDGYGRSVYDAGPDLYWRLEQTSGTTAVDTTPTGQNPGTIGSAVQLGQPGQVNGGRAAATSDQANSLIVSPRLSSPTELTLQLWFKTTTTAGGKLIGMENTANGDGTTYDKMVYLTDAGHLVFGVYTGGKQTLQTAASYNDGHWHQVVATQDSSGMRLYVDGSLQTSNAITTNQASGGYWRVGGGNLANWPSRPTSNLYTGLVDEVAVYGKALSASTIATQYDLGR